MLLASDAVRLTGDSAVDETDALAASCFPKVIADFWLSESVHVRPDRRRRYGLLFHARRQDRRSIGFALTVKDNCEGSGQGKFEANFDSASTRTERDRVDGSGM